MVGGTLITQLCSLSVLYACLFLCTTYFCRHRHCCVYLVQGTGLLGSGFREKKTNKYMSSVSFIAGQPVISSSTVVSLRRCRLICLSLSKTCLCGPLDRLHACSEIACGLGVCEVYVCVCLIVNYEFFSHAPAPV